MKKYLMMAAAVIALASCTSSNEGGYNPNAELEATVVKYSDNFVKTFGKPSATQTWGFKQGANKSATRAANKNQNQYEDNGWVIPEDITPEELAKVLAVFNQEGEKSYTSLVDMSDFFVQQVYKGVATYTAKDNTNIGVASDKMNWLCAYDPVGYETVGWDAEAGQTYTYTNHDDHINDFNKGDNTSTSVSEKTGKLVKYMTLMENSSTTRFGFSSTVDNGHVFYNFRMEEIDGNYYVGFDFEAAGVNGSEQVERDYIYNDWIVKIVPGKGNSRTVVEQGIIICEDLGTTDDFDFNDVVFEAKVWSDGSADITLLAAGGTLPLTVAGEEVHGKFGVATNKMVNTGATGGVTKSPVSYSVKGSYKGLIDIPVVVKSTNSAGDVTNFELTAQMGKAPQKICVPAGFKWTKERKSLVDAYPGFKTWTTGAASTWTGSYDASLLYNAQ